MWRVGGGIGAVNSYLLALTYYFALLFFSFFGFFLLLLFLLHFFLFYFLGELSSVLFHLLLVLFSLYFEHALIGLLVLG